MNRSTKKQLEQLIQQQRRTNKLLTALAAQFAELQLSADINSHQQTTEAIESLRVGLGDVRGGSLGSTLDDVRTRIDDMLVAQQRTNRLLELALRAGFDDEELLREL